jgi:hypothetical protein
MLEQDAIDNVDVDCAFSSGADRFEHGRTTLYALMVTVNEIPSYARKSNALIVRFKMYFKMPIEIVYLPIVKTVVLDLSPDRTTLGKELNPTVPV